MSAKTPSPGSGAPAGIDAAVDALVRQCSDLQSSMARGRAVRMLLTLAMLGFLVYFGMAYYNKGRQIQSEENVNQLVALAQSRLEERSADYMNEVEGLISASTPVLTEAFYERAKQDLPHYMAAMGEERDALVKRLQSRVQEKLMARKDQMLESYRGVLKQEFPDLTEEQYGRMIDNLEVAVERLAERYYRDEIQGELNRLYDSWDHFPRHDAKAVAGVRTEKEFLAAVIDLVQHKLTAPDRPSLASASQ